MTCRRRWLRLTRGPAPGRTASGAHRGGRRSLRRAGLHPSCEETHCGGAYMEAPRTRRVLQSLLVQHFHSRYHCGAPRHPCHPCRLQISWCFAFSKTSPFHHLETRRMVRAVWVEVFVCFIVLKSTLYDQYPDCTHLTLSQELFFHSVWIPSTKAAASAK